MERLRAGAPAQWRLNMEQVLEEKRQFSIREAMPYPSCEVVERAAGPERWGDVVIVRKDLLGRAGASVPAMMNYQTHAENGSMYNTPPTFAWYLAGLVFQWLKEQGGVDAMGEINRRKADKLYGFIDASGFYSNPVAPTQRSWMNVPFILSDSALDKAFLAEADAAGLRNLKGHRSVGGMRASIYNAVPETAVDALIDFMADFEKRNG